MVVAQTNTYGIDKQLKRVQDYFDEKFASVWDGTIIIYGRAIETTENDAKRLEVYTDKNDYQRLTINDRISGSIVFKVNDRLIDENRLKAGIDVIFMVNVKDVEGTGVYMDEKALMNAYKIVSNCGLLENVTDIKVGIDAVFSGYDTEGIEHRDMSPFHVFSFTTQLEYFENLC